MVYPALTYLEEIGHATVEADGARKLYHITEAGKEHLEANRSAAEALFAQFGRVGERMDRVRRAMTCRGCRREADCRTRAARFEGTACAPARSEGGAAGKWDAPREEQQRIVDMLKRAIAEIRGR